MTKTAELPEDFVDHDDDAPLDDDGSKVDDPQEDDEEEEDEGKKPEKKSDKEQGKKPEKKSEKSEEEDEEDDEEEGDEEEDDEEEEKGKKSGKKAPDNPRLERMRKQRDRYQQEAAQLRAEKAAREENQSDRQKKAVQELESKLDKLYEDVEEARAKGETKEAARLQRELDKLKDGMTRAQAQAIATREAVRAADTRAFNSLVKELESLDPRFDPESDDYDEDLIGDITDLVSTYESRGVAAPDALRKACKTILREDPFKRSRTDRQSDLRRQTRQEREEAARKKAVDTTKKQPVQKDNGAERSRIIDVRSMKESDFDKLSDAELAKLDGSEIE